MNIEEIKQKVNEIILDVLGERISSDDIKPEGHLVDDLGAESSEILEIFLSIMSDFSIDMDRNMIKNLKDLNDLYDYIHQLVNEH